jgi:hypothetical protein
MLGTLPNTFIVARSQGHSDNTYLVPDENGFHHSAMNGDQKSQDKGRHDVLRDAG